MAKYVWLGMSVCCLMSGCALFIAAKNMPDTKAAANSLENIKGSANKIDKLAGATVPEVKPETEAIRNEADKLAKVNEQTEALEKTLADTQNELRLEKEKGSALVRHCITLAYGLGILAIAVGFFLRAPSVVIGGVGGLVGAAVASWVLSWAWAIGLVSVCGAGAYYLFVQRKAIAQVVATTEIAKKVLDSGSPEATDSLFRAEDSVANKLQSKSTKAIVKGMRKRLGFSSVPTTQGATTDGNG